MPRPRRPVAESKVNWVPFAFPKRMVEEAERPLVSKRRVEVELAAVPKEVVGVQGKAVETVAQATTPEELVVSA